MHPGVPQACRPGGGHPAIQAGGRERVGDGVPAPTRWAVSTPTTYRQPVSRLWWAKKPTYFLFLMRDLSCVFVAWSVVFLGMLVYAVGRGEASYQRFLAWASSPVVVVVNVVALAFLVLHTVTWFAVTPQAMAVRGPG